MAANFVESHLFSWTQGLFSKLNDIFLKLKEFCQNSTILKKKLKEFASKLKLPELLSTSLHSEIAQIQKPALMAARLLREVLWFQGENDSVNNPDLVGILPHVAHIVNFIAIIQQDEEKSDALVNSAVGLVG